MVDYKQILLLLENNFSKWTGCKINSNGSVDFLYSKNKWADNEITETTPIITVTNDI